MTDKDYNDCVSKYSDDVYRFVVYSGMDRDSAKDIVQELSYHYGKNIPISTLQKPSHTYFRPHTTW